MTSFPTHIPSADAHDDPHHDAHHDVNADGTHGPAHLAHHFDTPTQQYASGKLGMWVFLGTEILMFGGLFVAYFVYRANNPDVFQYAAQSLNVTLGFINTLILITSSLTMALAVRAIQLGNKQATTFLLILTLLGGFGFLGVKSVEYYQKISKGYFVGKYNVYSADYAGPENEATAAAMEEATIEPSEVVGDVEGDHADELHADGTHTKSDEHGTPKPAEAWGIEYVDPNAGSGDAAVIRPTFHVSQNPTVEPVRDGQARIYGNGGDRSSRFDEVESLEEDTAGDVAQSHEDSASTHGGLAASGSGHGATNDSHGAAGGAGHHIAFKDLSRFDQERVGSFYSVYFAMTGLHVVHVIIGMALIGWIAVKNATGIFTPAYFTPVDIVGLYWHLVDLIWIFLFPLLYLIH